MSPHADPAPPAGDPSGRPAGPARRRARVHLSLVSREVSRSMAAGLLAALLVGIGTFVVVSRDAETQAIQHAQDITELEGHDVVEPALTTALLSGDPQAIAAVDVLVHRLILSSDVVRVKIWQTNGTIVYSDQQQLIGRRFSLEDAEITALRTGTPNADVSDLTAPENQFERSFGTLLQVYLPVRTPDGTEVLFETYQRYQAISQYQQTVWSSFLPVLVAGIAVLFLVQIPLSLRLARRLRGALAERESLLQRVISASEQERRRIARDLHDGVVQRMAGINYSLSALGRRLHGTAAQAQDAASVDHAAEESRRAMRELRTLIIEIAPPNLHAEGIDNALHDLLEPLARQGLATSLDAPHQAGLSTGVTTLLFRVAQEALRNAGAHAAATAVKVRVATVGGMIRLEIEDDGRGFSPADLRRSREEGHVGLSLLTEMAADAGGTLTVASEPGGGTRVALEVPCA